MKTRVDECQFIVVAQNDYYAILNQVDLIERKDFFVCNELFVQGEKSIRKIEENGKVVMIKEIRIDDEERKIPREIVIKVMMHFDTPDSECVFVFRLQSKNYWIYWLMNIN